jgi:lysophospholipase L1-like esterase
MLLFTVGDSFTYGEELEHPEQHAWPVLVAKELGYDLINRGRPAASNDYMIKEVIKSVTKNRPDLVIVAWSSAGRTEFSDHLGVYSVWPGSNLNVWNAPELAHRKQLVKYITVYNNLQHEYRRWLRNVVLLQSFLRDQSIDYRFVNTFDNLIRGNKYIAWSPEYTQLIDTDKFIGWPNTGFMEWAYGTPHGPGGHPLEEGHQLIAENIVRYIKDHQLTL